MRRQPICMTSLLFFVLQLLHGSSRGRATEARISNSYAIPVVINTWPFIHATQRAWQVLQESGTPVEAVVAGCSVCEEEQCDFSVGFGGSPDESGETTLDAMVMDGDNFNVGAVGDLRRVKGAIQVAKYVLENTGHTLLVGDHATEFALQMGRQGAENLTTNESASVWKRWKDNSCQPNFRANVYPNSTSSCGPYNIPSDQGSITGQHSLRKLWVDRTNHDTITMVAISRNGSIASGGSTNGLTFKVPGRVGDTPIPGAGSYADSEFGGCGATGDGDIMLRFLPCYQAVENLRRGMPPKLAADNAIGRIKKKFPGFVGALFVINRQGEHAGATSNWNFQYAVASGASDEVQLFNVYPSSSYA